MSSWHATVVTPMNQMWFSVWPNEYFMVKPLIVIVLIMSTVSLDLYYIHTKNGSDSTGRGWFQEPFWNAFTLHSGKSM